MPGGAGTPGGYGGGAGFGGSSSGGGGRTGGGGGGGEGGAAMRAAAQREEIARAAAAAAAAEQARTDALNAQRAAQQAAEGRVDVGFQEALKKTADARQREEEFLDTGDYDVFADTTLLSGPQVDIRDIQGEVTDPGSVSYNPLLKALDEPKVDEGFKRYVRQVQQPIAPTPKSGIGTTLKNVALGVLAPQLLAGTKFAPLYQGYRTYETAKRFIPKGIQETIRTAFTPNLKPRLTTETKRKTTPFVASGGDGQRVKTVAEKVATGQGLESGAKLLGVDYLRQKEEARRRGKIIADILNKNSYQGKDLTPKQRNDLINYIEQINKFLVPTVQGA